jgi:HK97 family phage major capsid protein
MHILRNSVSARTMFPPQFETKGLDDEADEIDVKQVVDQFGKYHDENKKLFAEVKGAQDKLRKDLDTEKKEREELELRMTRPGAGGDVPGEINHAKLGEERKAIGAFARTGDDGEMKAMSVGSDPDGGYLVLPQVSMTLQKKIFDLDPIRQIARIETIGMGSGDAFEEPWDTSDVDAIWVGETAGRSETTGPQVGKIRVPLNEIYALIKASQRLIDDSQFDIGAWIENKMADKFARSEGTAFISGDGMNKSRGFLTGPTPVSTGDATRAQGTLQYVATGGTSDFAGSNPADVLRTAFWTLRAPYRANASWVMNSDTASKIDKFKETTTNGYLWRPGLSAADVPTILGKPVVICESMPSVGTDAFPIAFGDFRQGYLIVDRPGIKLLRDPYTAKPYVLFYAYRRTGGGLANTEAIKLIKCANS